MTHPCDACGGTGWKHSDLPGNPLPMRAAPCPTCLGAGRFSDQMPAKDAVADAETLRKVSLDASRVGYIGQDCKHLIDGCFACEEFDSPKYAAIRAARAAFRAVPALREE